MNALKTASVETYICGSIRYRAGHLLICAVAADRTAELLAEKPAAFRQWRSRQAAHDWMKRQGFDLTVYPISRMVDRDDGLDIPFKLFRPAPEPLAPAPPATPGRAKRA